MLYPFVSQHSKIVKVKKSKKLDARFKCLHNGRPCHIVLFFEVYFVFQAILNHFCQQKQTRKVEQARAWRPRMGRRDFKVAQVIK